MARKKIYLQRISKNIVFADIGLPHELKKRLTNTIFVINRIGNVFKYNKNGTLEPVALDVFANKKGYKTFEQYVRRVEKTSVKKIYNTVLNFQKNQRNAPIKMGRVQREALNRMIKEQQRRQAQRAIRQDYVEPPF